MDLETMHLDLTPEEANRLLCLCLVSPGQIDKDAETALRKLAQYIRSQDRTRKEKSGQN